MSRHISRQRLVFMGAMLLAGLTGTLVGAQEVLRLTRNIPGDSKPIVLNADAAATWTEGGQRVILLSGKVLVEHGLFNARCKEAVIWADEDAQKKTRVLRVQVYVEGDAIVENGSETKRGQKVLAELNTRGEVKLRVQAKVVQTPQLNDPLYVRALAARTPPAAPPPAKTADKAAPKGAPAEGIRPTGFQDKAAPPAGAPAPSVPPAGSPLAGSPLAGSPLAGPPAPSSPTTTGTPVTPAAPGSPGPSPAPGVVPTAAPLPGGPGSLMPPPLLPPPPGTVVPGAPPPPRGSGARPARPAPPGPTGALVPGAAPNGPPRLVTVAPRTPKPFEWQSFTLSTGEKAIVVTGGVALLVRNLQNLEIVDIEADRLVFWSHGDTENMFSNMRSAQGQATKELEFYLAGNVEIRQQTHPTDARTLRAEEIYYDVGRNVAVGVSADLELRRPNIPEPIHVRADELLQLSPTLYEATRAEVFASRLPSDPGLKVYLGQATVEQTAGGRRPGGPAGTQLAAGAAPAPGNEPDFFFRGTNVFFEVESVPVFYVPWLQGDVRHPLGPIIDLSLGGNHIYGFQGDLTLDAYDLFGITPIVGTRWRADVDYMSQRGPGLGTKFDYAGKDLLGIPGTYEGYIHSWGLHDTGEDILGGNRNDQDHPEWRGVFWARHNWLNMPYGFSVQAQVLALSDKNFFEQYFKNEFDTEINQQTFLYVKQQQGIGAWTADVQARIRTWETETDWLPRLDAFLLGASPFNLLTYSTHLSAGYAQLMPTNESPPALEATQARVNTARLDLWQELALPFYLGPVKVVPYGDLDLTYYSRDLNGNDQGRVIGAGGVRASIPFSRLYGSVCSELFNLNGLYHKIVVSGNYHIAHSDVHFNELPQLDPVNDEITDQALREMTPYQPLYNPQHGVALQTSPLYDPQVYAIRRLVTTAIDTQDTIEELQFDVRQRLQTKRGFPGNQHEVDWMVLDLSGSYFPHSGRDDFGHPFAFLEYNYLWNVGDRTALTSTGWVDPFTNGPRVFTVGAEFNRPDRTTFFLGYRHIDPLNSDAVTGAATYIFSPKYAMTVSSVYDFGTSQALANSLVLTRMGSDLQISIGITYNVLQNNFGATFMIVPNLLPLANKRFGPVPGDVAALSH